MKSIRLILLIGLFSVVFNVVGQSAVSCTKEDKKVLNAIVEEAQKQQLASLPINEIIIRVGKEFLGRPYVAHTLELPGNEQLVVDLRELDCTTFVESVLALSITIKHQQTSFDDYCLNLTRVRYRNATIDGYPSRQHYFADWIFENQKKGLVEDVTSVISTIRYEKNINFMSENFVKYPRLKDNPHFVDAIKATENAINNREKFFISKANIPVKAGLIKNGDIIAITPNLKNLDVAHVGFAVEINGKIHFMHASMDKKKVVITSKTLYDFLKSSTRNSGIMVVRAK